ncbi:MAG: DUF2437 domain-containing protein [Gemmatimonas sp.]|nr:DUF2437 domain-containing protein [Gemmatimonas sp.]
MKQRFVAIATGLMVTVIGYSPPAVEAAAAQATTQYVRYDQGGTVSWGVLEGETIHQLSDAPYLGGTQTGESVERSEVMLKAPVEPVNIYMTALNFRSHINGEPAEYPGIFQVPATSVIGPEEQMLKPTDTDAFHYEAEAVVVVGRECVNVSVEDAPDCIFGVTAGNDGSARDWQGADTQWTRAKGSRTFNAVGPVLVAGLDPNNVQVEGRLNGEVKQGENTSDMLFNFDYMVSYISKYFELRPGDLIWSGTMGSTEAMEPGDVYEVEIDGVGVLSTEIGEGF